MCVFTSLMVVSLFLVPATSVQDVPDRAEPAPRSGSHSSTAQTPGLPSAPALVPLRAGLALFLAAGLYGAVRLRRRLAPVAAGALVLLAAPAVAQDETGGQIPLSEILHEDGTLDLTQGVSGSVDLAGFRMDTGSDGEPLFVAYSASADDGTWADGFDLPGADDRVRAVAIGSDGSIYIGGDFTAVDGIPANRVARWDGAAWHSLGTGSTNGVNHQVFAIAVSGTDIYVGGQFTEAGGQTAHRVARWDGSQWHSLGSDGANGVTDRVEALAVSGTDLYVGGRFTSAGGESSGRRFLAGWDGDDWYSVGGGISGAGGFGVFALAVSGTDLYVGGLLSIGGAPGEWRFVRRWTGSSWQPLGGGVNNEVHALAVSGTDVFVGGLFTNAGGMEANRVARWDGTEWHSLGTGGANGVTNQVEALAVSGTDVFVGGWFTHAGGEETNQVARWDGTVWHQLGAGSSHGTSEAVHAFAVSGSDLYVGGDFARAGDQIANRLARWSGSTWHSLATGGGKGASHAIRALAVSGSDLYVGGDFTAVGGLAANHVARWDGSAWHTLGVGSANGVNHSVHALAMRGTELFVGGNFTEAGGLPAERVVSWDGSSWNSLGSGANNTVNALAVIDTDLYAGGDFTTAGGETVNRVARWDGSAWHGLGTGGDVGVTGTVRAFAVSGPDLFVGGNFGSAGGQSGTRWIARWDGDDWHSVGFISGSDGQGVFALAASGSDLFVGGILPNFPPNQQFVRRWDGSSWQSLGIGTVVVDGPVFTLAASGSELFVGGQFSQAGGQPANRVARWDGAEWHSLGTGGANGVNSNVHALAVSGTDVYVGGSFTSAGGAASSRIGLWLPVETFEGCTTASSGNWSSAITWTNCNGTTPGEEDEVRIAPGRTVTVDEPVEVLRLVIDGTLVAEDALTVTEHLRLAGTLTIDGGSVVLASGPTGRDDGVTIATFEDAGGSITGELTYERYYAHAERGWRMIGSPFAGVPFTSLNDDFQTQGALNADFEEGDPILYRYDADTGAWEAVADYEETATPGAGYIFYMFEAFGETEHLPGRWRIEGLQNAEPTSPALFYDGEDSTFNLVTNPFAGPLDWHEVHAAASGVGATYYVWETLGFEPDVGSTGVYRSYHTSGVGDAGRHIAPFQGFWVYTDAAGPSMVFTYAMKDFEASPVIVGRPAGTDAPLATGSGLAGITLALEGEGLVASRPTALFHTGETSLDAPYLWPLAAEYTAAYFSDEDGRALLYAGAPQPGDEDSVLPLHFEATRAGSYTFTWSDWHSVPDQWQLALMDHDTGSEVDLRTASSYTFSHSARAAAAPGEALVPGTVRRSTGQARFALIARTGPVSSEGEGSLPTVFAFESVYPNPLVGRATLRLAVPQTAEVSVTAYDLLGRVVSRVVDDELVPGIHERAWNASGLAAGVYLLRMSSGSFSQTLRVVVVR